MTIYSVSFYCGAVTETTLGLWQPSGEVEVVRDFELAGGGGGAPNDIAVFVCVSGTILSRVFVGRISIEYDAVQWQGRVVLPTGSSLGVGASYWPITVTASGYRLTLP